MLKLVVAKLNEREEKIKTALALLAEESTTEEKVLKVVSLLKGINPKIDKHLEAADKIWGKIAKVKSGDVINLSFEELPEKTEKQKKRKKMLLLWLGHWRDLKSEVERINALKVSQAKAVETAKILTTLKGPLGLITVAAAGIVAVSSFLNKQSVNVTIVNSGCRPIGPISERAVNLPGLKLPTGSIVSGSQGLAVVPGLKFKVSLSGEEAALSAFGFSKSFRMPGEIREIIYDGQTLMGKTSEVDLGKAKDHQVTVSCQ